jgi:hypothetical protein
MFSFVRIRLRWALLGAATAALIVSTAALGGSGVGGVFNLGQTNTVNGTSALTGTTAGSQLRVANASSASTGVGIVGQSASATGAGVQGINLAGGSALQATVSGNSVAPLKVNSTHLVPNLHAANSDALAGHAPGYFLPASGTAANSSKLGGKLPGGYWQLGGNASGATGVLGTTDNQALELKVHGARALRIEPNLTSPNVIGGFSGNGNSAASGAAGTTIAGGGEASSVNQVTDDFGTVGGGESNVAGNLDGMSGNATQATVGGGEVNTASDSFATVGGGDHNEASAQRSTVSGGDFNIANGFESAIAGGGGGNASGSQSFVAAGSNNTASGQFSFAAGRRAKATHAGSFVWGDSTNADVNSLGANTFTVRASGGTYIHGSENITGGALSTGFGTFADGATTPSVSGGNLFLTQNTTATTITDFTGENLGQTITILFGDNNTTVQASGTVLLKSAAAFAASTNDTLTLVAAQGNWYEVSRSVNH